MLTLCGVKASSRGGHVTHTWLSSCGEWPMIQISPGMQFWGFCHKKTKKRYSPLLSLVLHKWKPRAAGEGGVNTEESPCEEKWFGNRILTALNTYYRRNLILNTTWVLLQQTLKNIDLLYTWCSPRNGGPKALSNMCNIKEIVNSRCGAVWPQRSCR